MTSMVAVPHTSIYRCRYCGLMKTNDRHDCTPKLGELLAKSIGCHGLHVQVKRLLNGLGERWQDDNEAIAIGLIISNRNGKNAPKDRAAAEVLLRVALRKMRLDHGHSV